MDWTNDKIEELKRLIEKGLSHFDIAKKMNTTPDSIKHALNRYNINKTSDDAGLWIVLADIHDRPPSGSLSHKTYHSALLCAEKVIKATKPKGILYLGDTTDMDSLCHFDKDKRQKMEGKRYRKDIDSLKMMLDKHEKLSPNAKRIYMMGNHEDWVAQHVSYHPELEGNIDFIKDVGLIERGYEVVPMNFTKKLGKAMFCHGIYTGDGHAKRMATTYSKTIFYGHLHDVQSYSFVSPIDSKEVRIAQSLGCLCDLNPGYMKNKPNKWIHAFGMYYLNSDGTFQMDVKFVIKGKTVVNGKVI